MQWSLIGLCALGVAVWWINGPGTLPAMIDPAVTWPWVVREEALNLSGLLAITLMSWAMVLAARPRVLEPALGGLDRMYRTHKWAALGATLAALLHWGVEMADDILKAWIGRAGRVPHEHWSGLLGEVQHLAKEMGEWALYAVLVMVALALWKRFPYRPWRRLHHLMPALYLMLALHAVMLAPREYWRAPIGLWLAACLAAGCIASVWALLGAIGRTRRQSAVVVDAQRTGEVFSVRLRPTTPLRAHRPGQFAFLTFAGAGGAHPFTIASAPNAAGTVDFHIKALGTTTRALPTQVQVGQTVLLEGPYGRFDFARHDTARTQHWIGAGVGLTPFLAWLEASPQATPVVLHACVRDAATDALLPRVQALCAKRPEVTLVVHDAAAGTTLTAASLPDTGRLEVWFCGPRAFGEALQAALRARGQAVRWHQEAFELR